MKQFLFISGLLLLITSCGSPSDDQTTETTDSLGTQYSWEASLDDSTGNIQMNPTGSLFPDSISVSSMIEMMNKNNPNVQLTFLKISGDTLYLKIPEATYLTQQMGSTGPELYFAEAVYNLTEIQGIKYVNFALAEGDHAGPDIFSRESFKPE